MLIFLVASLRYKVYSPNEVAKDELSSLKLNPNRPPPSPPHAYPIVSPAMRTRSTQKVSHHSLPPSPHVLKVFTWLADDPQQLLRGGHE